MTRFFSLIRVVFVIRKLSKIHESWDEVYRSYIVCLRLMIMAVLLRYVADFLLASVALSFLSQLLYFPPLWKEYLNSYLGDWTDTVISLFSARV